MKRLILILTVLLWAGVSMAQQKAALYATESSDANLAKVVNSHILKNLNFDGTYKVVERTEQMLKMLNKEHEYQRSGAVDDEQIAALGQQLGVDVVVVVDVASLGEEAFVSAKIINVTTGEIVSSGSEGMEKIGFAAAKEAAEKVSKQLLFLD